MGELGLKRKLLADEGPLKINSRHVRDLESHLEDHHYTYLLLELVTSDNKSPINKKRFIVKSGSHPDAFGLEYDNRNNDGQFPKNHHVINEVLINDKSNNLSQEQIDALYEIDSWLKMIIQLQF